MVEENTSFPGNPDPEAEQAAANSEQAANQADQNPESAVEKGEENPEADTIEVDEADIVVRRYTPEELAAVYDSEKARQQRLYGEGKDVWRGAWDPDRLDNL